MASAGEDVDEAYGGSGFSGSRGHDEKAFSDAVLEVVADGADGFFLVVAVGDFVVYRDCPQVFFVFSPVDEPLYVGFGEDGADLSWRCCQVVPEVGFESVGVEHDGPSAVFSFEAVGVEFALLFSDVWVFAGFLCFDDCKGFSVFSEEDVVGKSGLSVNAGHGVHFEFVKPVLFKFPALVFEVDVDVFFAGFEF